MSDATTIGNDETLLRHVPGGTTFQAPGPRLTSVNFQMRAAKGETGISVTSQDRMSLDAFVAWLSVDPASGSRVAAARAGDVRALGLQVVPDPLPDNSGHAEIRSGTATLDDRDTRRRLANLLRFVL